MKAKQDDGFTQGLKRLMDIWDQLSLIVAQQHPDLPEEERDKLTRKAMDEVIKQSTTD